MIKYEAIVYTNRDDCAFYFKIDSFTEIYKWILNLLDTEPEFAYWKLWRIK